MELVLGSFRRGGRCSSQNYPPKHPLSAEIDGLARWLGYWVRKIGQTRFTGQAISCQFGAYNEAGQSLADALFLHRRHRKVQLEFLDSPVLLPHFPCTKRLLVSGMNTGQIVERLPLLSLHDWGRIGSASDGTLFTPASLTPPHSPAGSARPSSWGGYRARCGGRKLW